VESVKRLVDIARSETELSRTYFEEVLVQSNECLSPLAEPLTCLDLSEHRWLANQREEAYSDWLQWIFTQLTPSEILRVLGVRDDRMEAIVCGCHNVSVHRERWVAFGHEGATGRLDLMISFDDEAPLVVEVKLSDAEHADTGKGTGYRKSVPSGAQLVLLVAEAEEEEYCGFKPRRWADVCIELRRVAADMISGGRLLPAAMFLAFVAAVEQNLLQLQVPALQSAGDVALGLGLRRVADHLSRFLEDCEYAQHRGRRSATH
jgi:hypothetical protein